MIVTWKFICFGSLLSLLAYLLINIFGFFRPSTLADWSRLKWKVRQIHCIRNFIFLYLRRTMKTAKQSLFSHKEECSLPASCSERDFLFSHCSILGSFSPFGFPAGASIWAVRTPHPVLWGGCAVCGSGATLPSCCWFLLLPLQGQLRVGSVTGPPSPPDPEGFLPSVCVLRFLCWFVNELVSLRLSFCLFFPVSYTAKSSAATMVPGTC